MISVPPPACPLADVPRVCWWVWLESRPVVQAIVLLRFVSGCALAGGSLPGSAQFAGGLAWVLVTAGVYVFNGAADVVEDTGNGSGRPVASGRLDPGTARRAAAVLAGTGLLLSLAQPAAVTLLGAVTAGLGWAYSAGPAPLKKSMTGFLATVVLAGVLTYLAGWVVAGGGWTGEPWVFVAPMALWIGLAGSTKDLGDVPGDRAAGRRTWPVVLGDRRARVLIGGLALGLGLAFALAAGAWSPRLLPVALTVLLGAGVLVRRLARAGGDRARARQPYRAFMMTQYAAHVLFLGSMSL